eukprot:PITA_08415
MDYFTKWIEAIPTRQATDAVIISFLENNILSRFGCPNKLIADNVAAFKSKRMIEFVTSIKSFWVTQPLIIRKAMVWQSHLINLYSTSSKICWKLTRRVGIRIWSMHFWQIGSGSEEDPMQRRLNQMVHLQQTQEEVFQNTSKLQKKIKKIYDRKVKADGIQLEEVVLKWDARNEDKRKHGKFENLWKGPFKIAAYHG